MAYGLISVAQGGFSKEGKWVDFLLENGYLITGLY